MPLPACPAFAGRVVAGYPALVHRCRRQRETCARHRWIVAGTSYRHGNVAAGLVEPVRGGEAALAILRRCGPLRVGLKTALAYWRRLPQFPLIRLVNNRIERRCAPSACRGLRAACSADLLPV